MSALDELVAALQAALVSVRAAREHCEQAAGVAKSAVEAAVAFGRERAVAETEALRADVEEAGGILTAVETRLSEALERAVALTAGTAGAVSTASSAGTSPAAVTASAAATTDTEAPPVPIELIHIRPDRRVHILDGDENGGGHRYGTGKPTKTEFPKRWDDDTVMAHVEAAAREADTVQYSPETSWGRPEQWMCTARRDGVDVVAIVRTDGQVWAAWPLPGGRGVVDNREGRS